MFFIDAQLVKQTKTFTEQTLKYPAILFTIILY
jgi:hypothetical protein